MHSLPFSLHHDPSSGRLSEEAISPLAVHGGLKFYEIAHVKDLIAHLKLFVNPLDESRLESCPLLISGIGPRTVERLLEKMSSPPDPLIA